MLRSSVRLITCDLNSQLTSENSNLIAKVKLLEQSNAEKEMTINLIRKVRNEKMFVSMWMTHIFNFSYLNFLQAKQASDLEQIRLREEKGLVDVKVSELQNKLEDVKAEEESKIKLLQGKITSKFFYG